MVVYVKVSNDDLELPEAVADTQKELADLTGVSISAVCAGVLRYLQGKKSNYRKIEIVEK